MKCEHLLLFSDGSRVMVAMVGNRVQSSATWLGEVGLEVGLSQRRKRAAVRTRGRWAGRPPLAGKARPSCAGKAGGVLPRHPSPVIRAWLCSEAGVLRALSG